METKIINNVEIANLKAQIENWEICKEAHIANTRLISFCDREIQILASALQELQNENK